MLLSFALLTFTPCNAALRVRHFFALLSKYSKLLYTDKFQTIAF